MKSAIEITAANFQPEVLESSQPVVVDFWATWCGPCKMLAPALNEIAAENAGRFKVVKVNVDENPELAGQFSICSVPTLVYFSGGEVRDQTIGVVSKQTIISRLERLSTLQPTG